MSEKTGYFIDWDGQVRSTEQLAKGQQCEIDRVAKYVAIKDKYGSMLHEATFYASLESVRAAGVTAPLVSES
ncbi:MAG TPA: hypothetical protein VGJ90_09715 [Methylophilaceae bacterium]|jgi:hypothetical protein